MLNYKKEFERELTSELSGFLIYLLKSAYHYQISRDQMDELVKKFTGGKYGGFEELCSIFYLLENQEFISGQLYHIVRQISHSTRDERVLSEGAIRGRIDWGASLKEWCSHGYVNKNAYVCREAVKEFDTPENLLLKYVLKKTDGILKRLPTELVKEISEQQEKEKTPWTNDLALMSHELSKYMKNVYIKSISSVNMIDAKTESRAKGTRKIAYHKAIEAYDMYNTYVNNSMNLIQEDNIEEIRKVLNRTSLLALDENARYEIYALIKVLNGLNNIASVEDLHWGPIKSGREEIAFFEKVGDGLSIRVYYNTLPAGMKNSKEYSRILEIYKLPGGPRRPDIILEFTCENNTYYLLIEVKNTNNRDYIVDGLYKVFGYLKDYEEVFKTDQPNTYAILVVGDGVSDIPYGEELKDLQIAVVKWSNIQDNVSRLSRIYLENLSNN